MSKNKLLFILLMLAKHIKMERYATNNHVVKKIILFVLLNFFCFLQVKAQTSLIINYKEANKSSPSVTAFVDYVSKGYRLPDTLRNNCEWMYAIIKVKTDNHNKIISYNFVNKPLDAIRHSFDFLIGYQFSKGMKINRHPIVFFFSIDNTETCIPKEGEKRFYAPNEVVETIVAYYYNILHDDPQTIIIPSLIMQAFYSRQQ